MKALQSFVVCLILGALASAPVPSVLPVSASARTTDHRPAPTPVDWLASRSPGDAIPADHARRTAAFDTLVLASWTFDGAGCEEQGWTVVDKTQNPVVITRVEDFAGLGGGDFGRLHAISGDRSMWCGQRPSSTDPNTCGYASLPGYGNDMSQTLTTRNCLYPVGDVVFDYYLTWDVEPSYDFVAIEIDHCDDNWVPFPEGSAGCGYYGGDLCSGFTGWGVDSLVSLTIPAANHGGQFRVRIHAASDGAWSDQDGMWNTDGAYITDDLLITDQNGVVVPLETFESAPLGATEVTDWVAGTGGGFGKYAGVVPGSSVLQRGTCVRNLSCFWAFFVGSTYNYSCGGYPAQPVVPFKDAEDRYFFNEIWSPWFENAGAGNDYFYDFDVMRDLPLDNLVFFVWSIRSRTSSCPGAWRDFNFLYYGTQLDWERVRFPVGSLVEPGATHLQLAFGVWDACGFWCGIYGSGACHSNGPLMDNPRLLRVNVTGPSWSIRDMDQFQDNFAEDGTLTGTVRADMARDLLPSYVSRILPGDSAVVGVSDPTHGLGPDPTTGSAAVYCYVSVWPQGQPGKSGAALQAPETRNGSPRYPVVGTWTDGRGIPWTIVRMDSAGQGQGYYVPTDRFCVDLRDDLFTPGDTICFFYSAKNQTGVETYAHGSSLADGSLAREAAAANPAEFTCLPAGGWNRGGDVLYVDGMDGRGSQPYWDTALDGLAIRDKVDRFDVRAPSSSVSNRPAGRVTNVVTQLANCYRVIVWDCGDLSVTLGTGPGSQAKTDDYGLLNTFLNNRTTPGGVYLSGDDVAERLSASSGSAATFRTSYLTYALTTGNHRPLYGVSPAGIHVNGGCYDDSFIIQGGCPMAHDFDVLTPTGSTTLEVGYGAPASTNGAVLARMTNNGSTNVGVILSGFAFENIRDNDQDGVSDRTEFLASTLNWLGSPSNQPTGAGTLMVNRLVQNHPNPFNPRTTIGFSIRERGRVRLEVFDVAGRLVRTLVDDDMSPGAGTAVWNGRNDAGQPVASGVYFYRLVATGFSQTKRMVLLK